MPFVPGRNAVEEQPARLGKAESGVEAVQQTEGSKLYAPLSSAGFDMVLNRTTERWERHWRGVVSVN